MKTKREKLISSVFQLIILFYQFNSVSSLWLRHRLDHNPKGPKPPESLSRQARQILPTSNVLLPNVGQYLALIQILVLKLVIWTQIMRLLGQDYVGKGIKSTVPLSEQEDLDEILDYDDLESDYDLRERKRRRKRMSQTIPFDDRTHVKQIRLSTGVQVLERFAAIVKLNNTIKV